MEQIRNNRLHIFRHWHTKRNGIMFPKGVRAITPVLVMGVLLSLSGCAAKTQHGKETETFSATNFVMDTVLQETVYGQTDVTQEIADRLTEIETGQLSWREEDSEVAQINTRCAKGESVAMSEDFYNWTKVSLDLAERSGGAFVPPLSSPCGCRPPGSWPGCLSGPQRCPDGGRGPGGWPPDGTGRSCGPRTSQTTGRAPW